MRQKEFQNLLKKYREGLCTPEEEQFIENWFRAMDSGAEIPLRKFEKDRVKERSWTRVQDHIARTRDLDNDPENKVSSGRGIRWAIAATITLAIAASVFLFTKPASQDQVASSEVVETRMVVNTTSEVMKVQLSDSTAVSLQPNSHISYTEPFSDSERLVTLEGAAFFHVSEDPARPFLVTANEVVTRVLGTSFTVSAFPDDVNVTIAVMTGRVSVITKDKETRDTGKLTETILTPNQKIIYNRNNNAILRAIVKDPLPIVPDEQVKRMHFEAAPIGKIFEALEIVYGVDIKYDRNTFSSCILTTSIGDGGIYDRLDMICKAIDARYTLRENVIVISGSGCRP